jgi:hypothetical protein
MPLFDGNFTMPDIGDFNRTGPGGGPDGGFPRNGTIPDGGVNMPDMSGAPDDMQLFNSQSQESTSADNTLLIAGIAIAAVISVLVVVVVLKKRKAKPAPMVADQSVPPPTSESSATL